MSSLANRLTSTDGRIAGRIRIELTDEELADVCEVARARNESYQDGRTTDTNYSDGDGQEIHEQGIMAEKAMAMLYDEASVDRSISAMGDDGIDCQLEIDGELVSVDVKSSSYENAWMLAKTGFDHENADAFVSAYVDEDAGMVELVGFAWNEELIDEDNLEESPSQYQDHMNYTLREIPNDMPEPNTDRDWTET
jgi:hypothetical protein